MRDPETSNKFWLNIIARIAKGDDVSDSLESFQESFAEEFDREGNLCRPYIYSSILGMDVRQRNQLRSEVADCHWKLLELLIQKVNNSDTAGAIRIALMFIVPINPAEALDYCRSTLIQFK